eukprot:1178187-Prorocentrum_minimum.AAC.4
MAPLGPAPAMVGKDSSMNPSCCPRTSISLTPTCGGSEGGPKGVSKGVRPRARDGREGLLAEPILLPAHLDWLHAHLRGVRKGSEGGP